MKMNTSISSAELNSPKVAENIKNLSTHLKNVQEYSGGISFKYFTLLLEFQPYIYNKLKQIESGNLN